MQSWDLEDFLRQIQQVRKIGPPRDLMKSVPDTEIKKMEDGLKHTEAIVRSMTLQERHNPRTINASRRRRIAKGSGTSLWDVVLLLLDFDRSRRMFGGAG